MKIYADNKIFSKNFRRIRKKLDLTQEEMSEKVYANRQTIFRYEKGEAAPGLNVLIHLANELNVNLNWLLNEKCENEEMFLKKQPVDYGAFNEEIQELHFLIDQVPFVRAAILKHFVLYKFENKKEIKQFLEKNGLS